MMLLWIVITVLLNIVLCFISIMFLKNDMKQDSNESFECGMETFFNFNSFYCLHFFLIGVLFLVFDMEIIICIPMIFLNLEMIKMLLYWSLMMIVLIVGYYLELAIGTLNWKE
uniref:NADH-ubiquinone oxidoreductase chain 3 n=1 Tax=Ibidoecus bisignatus TaxID=236520 RepID=G1EN86_9NEOP|nr:NADH dehydrogenase subunit 3 [Ibidoecus bisignatus]AEM23869.1 NADH dehydrogenase subunit 3 [Ibidoecus bisignatus]UTT72614.1 NADH dehydrogenase subunit 3 [Ibidoecus bisignatus]